jgi:hypothetical protein
MLKLQVYENGQWRSVTAAFRTLIPPDCDVVEWATKMYLGYRFRVVFDKGEN